MKILQIIPTFDSGGAEHFVLELSNELCHQGHYVEVLLLYDVSEDNALRKALNPQIKVYTLHKTKGFEPRLFFAVNNFIRHRSYDVVHCHVGAIKYVALAAFICRKTTFVATIHSEASREAGKSLDKWSRKLMFCTNKCIPVTISKESENSFEAFYGRKADMIINGVSEYIKIDDIQLRENESQTVFLHPASCQPVKNQILLLAAFDRILKEGYNVRLVWVGSKQSKDIFKSLEPLMTRGVLYLGVVSNVRDYMVASDAICLSSKMEGMPMTIIEAFSVGCPVLCTPVGGCVNMIEKGKNGMMSDDLTVESYYRMFKAFITLSQEDRAKMSANAFASFPPYNVENCAKGYLKVYKNRNPKQ